jgi:hypothetical protein
MVVIVWVEEVDVWIEEKLYLRWEDGEEVMMWMNDEAGVYILEKLFMWEVEVMVVVTKDMAVAAICIGSYEEEV